MPDPGTYLTADKSPEFNAFICSFFPTSWQEFREGRAEKELVSLQGAERELAEQILLAELSANRHQEASCRGLALLGSRKAIGLLHKRIASGPDFWSAFALWQLESNPRMLSIIAKQVIALPISQRISAVIQLREILRPEIAKLLTKLLKDSDYIVRSHAVASLMCLYGLPTDDERMRSELAEATRTGARIIPMAAEKTFEVRIMSKKSADRKAAIMELLAAIGSRPLREDAKPTT